MRHKVWFIGDTHFDHEKVIEYDQRPFKTVEEMNQKIISNWKAKVAENDIVYHLGDFAFAPKERQKELLSQLPGRKMLVLGNHDKSRSSGYDIGWNYVEHYMLVNLRGNLVLLVHDPKGVEGWGGHIIHGHFHKPSKNPKRLCVSCNLFNYEPLSEKQVVKQLLGN